VVRGDELSDDDKPVEAASHYLHALNDDVAHLEAGDRHRAQTRLAAILPGIFLPAQQRAAGLVDAGAGVLALDVLIPLARGQVLGQRLGAGAGLLGSFAKTFTEAVVQTVGVESVRPPPPLEQLRRLRALSAQLRGSAEGPWALASTRLLVIYTPIIGALRARGQDLAALAFIQQLEASLSPSDALTALAAQVRDAVATRHLEAAAAASAPGQIRAHQFMARAAGAKDDPRLAREAAVGSLAIDVKRAGSCRGSLGAQLEARAQKAMAGDGRLGRAKVTLDVQRCATGKSSRTETRKVKRKRMVDSTFRYHEGIPVYKAGERCEKVCRCRNLMVQEKYWLEFRSCLRKDVVCSQECRPAQVQNGFRYVPMTVTRSKAVWDTVLKTKQVSFHTASLKGRARFEFKGQRFTVAFDSSGQDDGAASRAADRALGAAVGQVLAGRARLAERELADFRRAGQRALVAGDRAAALNAVGSVLALRGRLEPDDAALLAGALGDAESAARAVLFPDSMKPKRASEGSDSRTARKRKRRKRGQKRSPPKSTRAVGPAAYAALAQAHAQAHERASLSAADWAKERAALLRPSLPPPDRSVAAIYDALAPLPPPENVNAHHFRYQMEVDARSSVLDGGLATSVLAGLITKETGQLWIRGEIPRPGGTSGFEAGALLGPVLMGLTLRYAQHAQLDTGDTARNADVGARLAAPIFSQDAAIMLDAALNTMAWWGDSGDHHVHRQMLYLWYPGDLLSLRLGATYDLGDGAQGLGYVVGVGGIL
jgi:hypothetical protein